MMSSIDNKAIREFSKLELFARQVVEGFITGLHKSPFHGFSVEFSEHRVYNPGESVKNIDWKLFARTDKLFVKRFEEETNLRCQLVIDTSSSMYFPEGEDNKLRFSVYAAASIMQLLKKQRDAVGLSLFDADLNTHIKARSSSKHHQILLNQLEMMMDQDPQERKTAAIKALHQIAEAIPKRSLVVLFSDMLESRGDFDEVFSALQHLRYKKHEVVVFHVMDKKTEVDLEYENRPHVFIDRETGEELKINPAQLKKEYSKAVTEFKEEVKLKCGQYRIDYVDVDIADGFKQVLSTYLVKRQKMM